MERLNQIKKDLAELRVQSAAIQQEMAPINAELDNLWAIKRDLTTIDQLGKRVKDLEARGSIAYGELAALLDRYRNKDQILEAQFKEFDLLLRQTSKNQFYLSNWKAIDQTILQLSHEQTRVAGNLGRRRTQIRFRVLKELHLDPATQDAAALALLSDRLSQEICDDPEFQREEKLRAELDRTKSSRALVSDWATARRRLEVDFGQTNARVANQKLLIVDLEAKIRLEQERYKKVDSELTRRDPRPSLNEIAHKEATLLAKLEPLKISEKKFKADLWELESEWQSLQPRPHDSGRGVNSQHKSATLDEDTGPG